MPGTFDPNLPRNTDQEQLPKREGDGVAHRAGDEGEPRRDGQTPLPEEESYEREPTAPRRTVDR